MTMLLVIAAVAVGTLLAVQASANQQLNRAVGTPYGASLLQLGLAFLVLTALAALAGSLLKLGSLPDVRPGWLLLGGLASPLYITAGILLFPRLGALAAVGLFVTGQVLCSMVLDATGWLAVPQEPTSMWKVAGAVVLVVGIAVIVRAQHRNVAAPSAAGPSASRGIAGWVLLGLLAGGALPAQGAVNARLREQVDAPLAVATTSFAVATLAIAVALTVMVTSRRTPAPRFDTLRTMPWWGWIGGLCAATYVTVTFLLIPTLGAAVTVTSTVAGQQLASAAIDHGALLGMPRRPVDARRATGLALLVAGSATVLLG